MSCGLGDGDCDSDAHCAGSLRCGTNNCQNFHTLEHITSAGADCCYDPSMLLPHTHPCSLSCSPNTISFLFCTSFAIIMNMETMKRSRTRRIDEKRMMNMYAINKLRTRVRMMMRT